ncbi:WD repeat-containing protein DDB_G0290555-like [Zingiber officinale]|uniref:WD repeat-containing protein DDB_G0290555-like n=1 Tax=Zingiber officinale TaxID=94328 RepID=UPI001C4D8974|nr:WD repeat-containing protein DDB_G0290555-like [Zingiber officinale]XP_042438352.1 WD repeat-containing protein DDB_G0290555-like [Zingiber officinale]
MPRTSAIECPGCPPLRALTTDALGLIKVVEVHGNPGILKVVERWGQPDASSGVLAASYADDKIEPLLAVARKNGSVEILNSLNGESLCNTHTKQFGLSDTSRQDDHIVGLHLLKTKGINLSSRVATLLLCMENGNGCLKSIPMSGVLHDSDIGSQMSFNVCSAGKILCSSLAKSENFALFGGKGVEVNTWDLGNCTRIWTAKSPRPNSLGLSPPPWFTAASFLSEEDHRKIAAGTNNHQVRLYDTSAQRRPVMSVDYRETPIKAVCPDLHGYKVYVGNASGDLGSFDIRTGKLLGGFTGKCSGSIRSIRKHPELSVIASCGLDCYLRVWDTNTRQLLSTVFLKQHLTNVIFDSHFSYEGPGGNRHAQPSATQVHDYDSAGDNETVEDEVLPSARSSEASKMSKRSKTKKLDKEELPTSDNGQVYETKETNEIKKRRSKIARQEDEDDGIGDTATQSEVEDGEKSSEKHGKRLKPKKRKVSA